MAAEGEFPKVDGDVLYASEINLFKREQMEVYAGAGFDSDGATATDEQDHELTAFTASSLVGATYLKIEITVGWKSGCFKYDGTTYTGIPQIKIQEKYTGDSYSDILAYKNIYYNATHYDGVSSSSNTNQYGTTTLVYYYTLTANDLTNGCQIKIFSKSNYSTANSVHVTSSVTNIQTVVYPI